MKLPPQFLPSLQVANHLGATDHDHHPIALHDRHRVKVISRHETKRVTDILHRLNRLERYRVIHAATRSSSQLSRGARLTLVRVMILSNSSARITSTAREFCPST